VVPPPGNAQSASDVTGMPPRKGKVEADKKHGDKNSLAEAFRAVGEPTTKTLTKPADTNARVADKRSDSVEVKTDNSFELLVNDALAMEQAGVLAAGTAKAAKEARVKKELEKQAKEAEEARLKAEAEVAKLKKTLAENADAKKIAEDALNTSAAAIAASGTQQQTAAAAGPSVPTNSDPMQIMMQMMQAFMKNQLEMNSLKKQALEAQIADRKNDAFGSKKSGVDRDAAAKAARETGKASYAAAAKNRAMMNAGLTATALERAKGAMTAAGKDPKLAEQAFVTRRLNLKGGPTAVKREEMGICGNAHCKAVKFWKNIEDSAHFYNMVLSDAAGVMQLIVIYFPAKKKKKTVQAANAANAAAEDDGEDAWAGDDRVVFDRDRVRAIRDRLDKRLAKEHKQACSTSVHKANKLMIRLNVMNLKDRRHPDYASVEPLIYQFSDKEEEFDTKMNEVEDGVAKAFLIAFKA